MHKASIIVPAYNAAEYIGATLDSIMAQTFTDFECIVIDDGSTDKTVEVVKGYGDDRIKLIEQKNSGGPAKPRNVGLEHASGDYIFMFDSDDLMKPNKLEVSISAFDAHPSSDFLFTNFCSIDEQGGIINPDFLAEYDTLWNLLGGRPNDDSPELIDSANLCNALVRINFIGTSSVAIRAAALERAHQFNEELHNADDYLFWMTFLKNHNALFVDVVLHKYRIRQDGISNRSYLRRGPSRIKVLEILRAECEAKDHRLVLAKKLSKEYSNMAYAYQKNKDYGKQKEYARKSLIEKINLVAVKLLIQSIMRGNARSR